MKGINYVLFAVALVSTPAISQTYECVTVPKDQKIVFLPWWVPADELVWKWHPAKEATPEEEEDEPVCEGDLVFGPTLPDPRCDD
jgi:hypothetical protein